jgi:hypothetical protein
MQALKTLEQFIKFRQQKLFQFNKNIYHVSPSTAWHVFRNAFVTEYVW